MSAGSPNPHLPRGAGGPLPRAAGCDCVGIEADDAERPAARREVAAVGTAVGAACEVAGAPSGPSVMSSSALVVEPDALARLLVGPAVTALGFRVARFSAGGPATAPGAAPPAAVFVNLERVQDCRRAAGCASGRQATEGRRSGAPLLVGYGLGPVAQLTAHRAHGCADVVLRLVATDDRPAFAYLPAVDQITAAGLTPREADVLVLLLRGHSTPDVAVTLGVSAATARSHCRAVLRKLGFPDRGVLRARLLGESSGAGPQSSSASYTRPVSSLG